MNKRLLKKNRIVGTLLGALVSLCFSSMAASPLSGCPDFMDIEAAHVDLFTGHMEHPMDSIGRVETRHRVNSVQGVDPNTGGNLKLIPDGELKSVRLGNDSIGAESEAIVYHYIVDADNSLLFVNFAVVMEDPGHEFIFQPRFVVRITDKDGKLVNDCSEYDVSAAAGLEGFRDQLTDRGMVRWRDWSKIGLDLSPFVGQEVQVQFITYDCYMYGHFGYAYFTASCAPNKLEVGACSGSTFSMEAPAGFASYRWDNGDTTRISQRTLEGEEMNIYCEITSATGCQFIQSAYVSDKSIPVGGLVKDTICQGEPYQKNFFDLPAQMNVGTFGYNNIIVDPSACSASAEVNLELTVLQTYYPIEASICEGEDYMENGFSVSRPPVGIYLDTLRHKHSDGRCDSIVCLRLVVSETNHLSNEIIGDLHPCVNTTATYYVETDDNLSRYSWTLPENAKVVGGANSPQIVLYFTDDRPASLMLTGENGCGTSAVPVQIYPRPSYHLMVSDTVCQGESYTLGSIQLGKQNKAGVFTSTYSYTTAQGCDSSVVLTLHVLPLPQVSLQVSPDKTIFCDSSEVRLSVVSEGGFSVSHECEPLSLVVGDIYCTDGSFVRADSFQTSGKKADGVVFYIDDTASVAYVVALDELTYLRWSAEYYDILGIPNQRYLRNILDDMNGFSHTSFMRKQGVASVYPAAWEVDLESGWYIPAIGELRKLFGVVNEVNRSLMKANGRTIYVDKIGLSTNYSAIYASSSEYSSTMVCCFDSNFKVMALSKRDFYRYRPTRAIKLLNHETPKYKIGDLFVDEDGSKGIVCYLAPDGKSGTMVALTDMEDVTVVSPEAFDLLGSGDLVSCQTIASSMEEWSGAHNTKQLRKLGDASQFPAPWKVDVEHGWYIPSVAQMNHLYANSVVIDSSLVRHGGDIISYEDCWTSTFYGLDTVALGWYINMAQGNMMVAEMNAQGGLIRPMKDFTYCETFVEHLDTTCTYQWSSGDTTSSIKVTPRSSATYSVKVSTLQGGCATTLSKDLYVSREEPIVLNASICHGQRYVDDYFDEAESGTYTKEIVNGSCNQKVVLNLEVFEALDTISLQDKITAGAVYRKHGFNLKINVPGIFHDTMTLADHNGCDSVVCLRLEVLPAKRDTQYARVCQNESYRENGFDIPAFQSTVMKYWERADTASDGSQIVRVLGLYVDTVYQISMVDSACYLERYQKNGFDFLVDQEGYSLHYLTLQSATQCDSILALSIKALGNCSYVYYDTVAYNEAYRDGNFDLPAQKELGEHLYDTTYVDRHGCDSLVVLHLFVKNDDDIDIPTAFTPHDGNGVNDIFMDGYEIFVYDRYGLLVCHSQSGWDGTYRGTMADAGVYLYTIRFKTGKEKHGTVEIIKE